MIVILLLPDLHSWIVEIRARERTFEGAYGRTAMGCLGFALTVLRLFDGRFSRSKYKSMPSS